MGATLLPDSAHVMVDVLEWYLNSIFLKDSTPLEMTSASEQAESLMENFSSKHEIFMASGRVYNRLVLSMLVLPICAAPIQSADGQQQSNDSRKKITSLFFKSKTDSSDQSKVNQVVNSLIDSTPEDWKRWMEQLEFCRSCLLRSDASRFPPADGDNISSFKKGDDDVNKELKELPMFRDVYQECMEILDCHERLTRFRLALTKEQVINSEINVNALVRRYISNPEGEKTTAPLKYFSDVIQSMLRNFVLQKSSPLQSKKLWKLLPQNESPNQETVRGQNKALSPSSLVQTIQSELMRLLTDESSSDYSLFQVQSKVKTLARTWNDSILGIPVLARCGYHYQSEMHDMEDAKTLSSFGMEEEREDDTSTADAADESDYHTAEELLEDNGSISTTASSVAVVLNKEQRLQVRPRQSWKEDFTMFENIQRDLKNSTQLNNTENNDLAKTPKQRNHQNRRQRNSSPLHQNDDGNTSNNDAMPRTTQSSDDESVSVNNKNTGTPETRKRRRLHARALQNRRKKRQQLLKALDWSSDEENLSLRNRKIMRNDNSIKEENCVSHRRKRAARKSAVTEYAHSNVSGDQVIVKESSSPHVQSEQNIAEINDTDESSLPSFLRRSSKVSDAEGKEGEDEDKEGEPKIAIKNDIFREAKMGKAKGGKVRAMKKNGGTFCTGDTKEDVARIVSEKLGSEWRDTILLLPKEMLAEERNISHQSHANLQKRARLVFMSKLQKEYLAKGVEKYGTGAWEQIVGEAPNGLLDSKTPRQCETWYLQQAKNSGREVDV